MADIYIDFSAANDGDGTAHNQAASGGATGAFNTLFGKTFSSGDKVWTRRKSKTVTTAQSFTQNGAIVIGWPKSGDVYYATRPSGAQGDWDGDSDDYAEIVTTTNLSQLITISASSSDWHRFKFNSNFTSGSSSLSVFITGASIRMYNCYVRNAASSSSGKTALGPWGITIQKNFYAKNTVIELTNASSFATSTAEGSCLINNNVSGTNTTYNHVWDTCTLRSTGNSGGNNNGLLGTSSTGSGTNRIMMSFLNCTMSCAHTSSTSLSFLKNPQVSDIYMYNCSISLATTSTSIFGIDWTNATNLTIINLDYSGPRVKFASVFGGRVHFKRFNQTVNTTPAITVGETNREGIWDISIHNGTFINSTGNDITIVGKSMVQTQNCNFGTNVKSTDSALIVHDLDYEGTFNNFKLETNYGIITKEAVTRDGALSTFAWKIVQSSASSPRTGEPLVLGGMPPNQTFFLSLIADVAKTITVYGAYKGFSGNVPTKEDIWLDLDYYDDNTNNHRDFKTSREAGTLTSDSSTWTGDTSLTSFKLEITITPERNCVVPFRIMCLKPGVASSHIYIDPHPEIV